MSTPGHVVPPSEEAAALPPQPPVIEGPTLAPGETPSLPTGDAPVLVPGYELLGELGRGGMGVVYKARQQGLGRVVALKMILHADHAGADDLRRFQAEAEAIARLQHPHIIQIFEVGQHQGKPYFSLEFCPGGGLDRKLAGTPLPPAEAAALIETLARAMHAAHQAGVVHRDLKPANVLLTADGAPKITDFGLAKKLDEAGQTRTGAVMGTPSYMAPEQAGGNNAIGPATDVYALGAILYECLTGRPPFKAASMLDTLQQVVADEPVPPSRVNPKVPRDTETICLKCLQKQPSRRYTSAEALADDLRRFGHGEPIQARPVGALERAAKWVRRRPAIAALSAAAVLLALTAAAVGVWALDSTSRAYHDALLDRDKANEALGREKEALAGKQAALDKQKALLSEAAKTYAEVSERDFRNGNTRDSLNWMLRAYETAPGGDTWRLGYRRRLSAQGLALGRILLHNESVNGVAFSPDGRTALTCSFDNTVRLWEVASGREIAALRHSDRVGAVAFSPDGRTALTGSGKTARLWDAASGKELLILRHEDRVGAVAFSPDGRTVLTGSVDKAARLWDVASGKELYTLRHDSFVHAVAYGPDGRTVLTGSSDGTARLWDVASGREIAKLRHEGTVTAVAFSPDGRTALTGSVDQTARTWDAATGKEIAKLRHDKALHAVGFSSDGRTAFTSSYDKTARLWDAATGEQLVSFPHDAPVVAVAISPDGRTALTGSADILNNKGEARVWNTASGKEIATLRHDAEVVAVAISSDGRTALTGSRDKTARLWDAVSGKEIATLRHGGTVHTVAISPDGGTALTGSEDQMARLWDTASGKEIHTLPHAAAVYAVAYSPDGRTALTGSEDGTARLWRLPLPTPDEPTRVRAWVHVRTARGFSEQGPLRDLTRSEWLEQCRQLDALGGDWEKPPDARSWHRYRAADAEATDHWFAAVFHLRRLLAEEPGNAEYLERLGTALYRDGRFAEAVERLSEAVRKQGKDATAAARLLLAMARVRLGEQLAALGAAGLSLTPPGALAPLFTHLAVTRKHLSDALREIEATMSPDQRKEERWQLLRKEADALRKP